MAHSCTDRQCCGDRDGEYHRIDDEIAANATRVTALGERVLVTPEELIQEMQKADEALNGDSNDDEHDALFSLREWLSDVFESPDRRIRR